MVTFLGVRGWKSRRVRRPLIFMKSKMINSTSLGDDLNRFKDSPADDHGSVPIKQVVVVMDGLKEFTTEPLLWALQNLATTSSGCVVTLLGVMPWLNIPLSTKTWLDVWSVELEEVVALSRWKSEWIKSDFKYLKLKEVIDLCNGYGVELQKKVVMGYPLRLLVVEKIISLNATWVVFDRYRRNTRFYAKKIPSNIIVIRRDGEAVMIKGRPGFQGGVEPSCTPGAPPAVLPTPKLVISDKLKGIFLKESSQANLETIHEDDTEKDVSICV